MRSLSLAFREALFSQESGEVPVFLLTIEHDELDAPLRLSSDPTQRITEDPLVYGTQSRGEDYLFVGMHVLLPDERERAAPQSTMVINNSNRLLVPFARSVVSPPPICKIECVLASAPDDVEFDLPQLFMVNCDYNAGELTFNLSRDSLAREPYPADSFDPARFPGLFK